VVGEEACGPGAIAVLSSLYGSLRAEDERAQHARGPSSAVDHAPIVAGDMALPGSAHGLTGGIKSRLLGLRM
jgi:hypothetical protein